MNFSVFLRRIAILVILLLLGIQLGHFVLRTIQKSFFEEKGSLKIYLSAGDTINSFQNKELNHLKKKNEIIPQEIEIKTPHSYYLEKTLKSENKYPVIRKLSRQGIKSIIIFDNGLESSIRTTGIFMTMQKAQAESIRIKKLTGLSFNIQTKYSIKKQMVYYLLIKNTSKSEANEIAEKMKGYKIQWDPTK